MRGYISFSPDYVCDFPVCLSTLHVPSPCQDPGHIGLSLGLIKSSSVSSLSSNSVSTFFWRLLFCLFVDMTLTLTLTATLTRPWPVLPILICSCYFIVSRSWTNACCSWVDSAFNSSLKTETREPLRDQSLLGRDIIYAQVPPVNNLYKFHMCQKSFSEWSVPIILTLSIN